MEKIIEILIVMGTVLIAFGIAFGSIAIEIAHAIMEIIDENRTRKH